MPHTGMSQVCCATHICAMHSPISVDGISGLKLSSACMFHGLLLAGGSRSFLGKINGIGKFKTYFKTPSKFPIFYLFYGVCF